MQWFFFQIAFLTSHWLKLKENVVFVFNLHKNKLAIVKNKFPSNHKYKRTFNKDLFIEKENTYNLHMKQYLEQTKIFMACIKLKFNLNKKYRLAILQIKASHK